MERNYKELPVLLAGAGLGVGLMYLLDPIAGRRRRALLIDKVKSAGNQSADLLNKASRDLVHRGQGIISETKATFQKQDAPDEVLSARVRAQLGRVVSHPGAIEVEAHDGSVVLFGDVLAHEVNDLLAAVSKVRGVKKVENSLRVSKTARDIPALQGGSLRKERMEVLQENWSPAIRVLLGSAGLGTAALGIVSGSRLGLLAGISGLGVFARAATNLPFTRLTGLGAGRRAIALTKTIHFGALIEEVYGFWSNFENFPRFMTHVKEVRALENNRSHWVVDGPAGIPIEWDAEVTSAIPNQMLAWKTVEGSSVRHAGIIQFEEEDNCTRVHLRLNYNPPGGAIGHALASALGVDPKRQLDDDLARAKTFFETGKPARDAVQKENVRASGG